jgi:hypothetical protein
MLHDSPFQTLPAPSIPVVSETQSKSADGTLSQVLYIPDLMGIFDASRSTIDRLRRGGALPPEMPRLVGRPCWRRPLFERWLENGGTTVATVGRRLGRQAGKKGRR